MSRWGVARVVVIAAVAVFIAAAVPGGWVWYRHVVPVGVAWRDRVAYLDWSYDRGEFRSPDGSHRLLVRTNDPGALRAYDECFTWVMSCHWWGKRVVAGGYLPWDPLPPSKDQIPARWNEDGSFTIAFVPGPDAKKYPGGEVTVRLD